MNRRDKLLYKVPVKELLGLEIGALCRPVVKRTDGRILYSDFLSTTELKDFYRNDADVELNEIVDVDIITGRMSLADVYRSTERPDYIVASHVIEHVPDLIGWLNSLYDVLKKNGLVCLAIPDRRFTFDYLRSETRLSDVVTSHLMKAKSPLPHSIIDHTFNMAKVDALDAWNGKIDKEGLEKFHRPETVLGFARDAIENDGYHDVHCWTFTPISFAILFEQLAAIDLIKFSCERFFETEYGEMEFFVTLRSCDSQQQIKDSWKVMRTSLESKDSERYPIDGIARLLAYMRYILRRLVYRSPGYILRVIRKILGTIQS